MLTGATGRARWLALPAALLNEAVSPVEVAATEAAHAAESLWQNVAGLWGLRRQNARLEADVARLEAELAADGEAQAENAHLTALLQLQSSAAAQGLGRGIAATVIGRNPDAWWNVLVIDRGSRSGVVAGMAAVSPEGDLVGQVEAGVGPTTARVRLLTNPDFGVGIEVERAASRAQGVAVGQVGNPLLTATFFATQPDVTPGDILVTSGLNVPGTPGGFPAGLVVGTVRAVAPGPFGLMRQAVLAPAANLDALSLVLLLPGAAAP